jgi:hypothetical protein
VADQEDVRRIALGLPGVQEEPGGSRFLVGGKGFCWVWLERVHPRRARVPRPDVLGVWVGDEWEKQALLEAEPDRCFTEPHYDGYPAVLLRLGHFEGDELRPLLERAWRLRAPRRLLPRRT